MPRRKRTVVKKHRRKITGRKLVQLKAKWQAKRKRKEKLKVAPAVPSQALLLWLAQNQHQSRSLQQVVTSFTLPRTYFYLPLVVAGSGQSAGGKWVHRQETGDELQERVGQTCTVVTKNLDPLVGSRLVRTQIPDRKLWVVQSPPEPKRWWMKVRLLGHEVCVGVSDLDKDRVPWIKRDLEIHNPMHYNCMYFTSYYYKIYQHKRTIREQADYLGKTVSFSPQNVHVRGLFCALPLQYCWSDFMRRLRYHFWRLD